MSISAWVMQLARPARLALWLRFGDAIREGMAALQNGANSIDSYIVQAEITDVTSPGTIVADPAVEYRFEALSPRSRGLAEINGTIGEPAPEMQVARLSRWDSSLTISCSNKPLTSRVTD